MMLVYVCMNTTVSCVGEFGVVYKAHLVKLGQSTPEIVAVKTLKGQNTSLLLYTIAELNIPQLTWAQVLDLQHILGFFDENRVAELMKESQKMYGFEHPHVLNIIGVCVDAGPAPYIVMPFMANESLLAYIKKEKMNLVVPIDSDDHELASVDIPH